MNARDLASRLASLLRREQADMADFLVALADFDKRRGWLELGYGSLFDFLHRDLGLSKGAAHYRKTAAELIQRFPEIVEPLRDGRLCISSIVQLAKAITLENRSEMLPRFFHLSKREATAVAVAIAPVEAASRRDIVTTVRSAPERAPEPKAPSSIPLALGPAASAPVQPVEQLDPPQLPSRDCADPVTADLSRLHITVSRRFLDKLEAARAALSHSHGGVSMAEILETGLDLVLERDAKRKGLVEKPRSASRPSKPDHIPAAVKRAVWKRDQGRCQFPLESGGICGSTWRLQFDHVIPAARGGKATVENLRLACALHNDFAARQVFGDEWMNRFTRKGGAAGDAPAAGP